MTSTKLPLPPARKILKEAISFYRRHWHIIIGVVIVPLILNISLSLAGKNGSPILLILSAIIVFIFNFISYYALMVAVTETGLAESPQPGLISAPEKEKTAGGVLRAYNLSAYKKALKLFIPLSWVNGLAALAIIGGFFSLIVPAALLSVWLSFSLYVFLAENRRGLTALAASWYYVKGYWSSVFWRFLVFDLIFLGLFFVVGLIIAGPMIFYALKTGAKPQISPIDELLTSFLNNLIFNPLLIIYSFLIYQSLKEAKAGISFEAEEPKIKKNIKIFLGIGIAGIVILLIIAGILTEYYLRS